MCKSSFRDDLKNNKMSKNAIRADIKKKRQELSKKEHKDKSMEIYNRLISVKNFVDAKVVYVYADINNEVSTKQIIEYSLVNGKEVAVPKVEDGVMNFYKIESTNELEKGYYNILEPVNKTIPATPDIVLVPGVAFSYRLERLGYGGGYYDRFLKDKVIKIGLAFDFQIYENLPTENHDICMDMVITDKEIINGDKMENTNINNEFKNETDRQFYYMSQCKAYVHNEERRLGRKLKACICTFGCQMNFHDSEKLLGILNEIGYEETEDEHADLVVYNTCTVRENANLKIYGRLGYLSNLKKKNPNMKIALCGCMMQEKEVVEKIKKSYKFVDIIFGTHNIFKFAELLSKSFDDKNMITDIWDGTTEIVEELPSKRKYSFKSGVNIMYGCDNFCSYCIVPYVRGRERSRNPEDIIKEITGLVADGVVEIMLLGQNVNSYGKNLENPISFAELLKEVEKIEGLERIRFMTSHPKDLSDELIDVMAHSKKICKQMHLPIQSGSTRLLKIMNRHYTKEQYLELVDKLRKAIPDISLTTDIIVGFPGETEEDFEETLDVVRTVEYDSAFTFIYSKRTGTPAATMENQVPDDVIKDRFDRLLKEIGSISSKITDRYTGQIMEVLVEEENNHDETLVTGRLSNNTLVHFKGGKELIGKIVKVRLDEAKGFYYLGSMV